MKVFLSRKGPPGTENHPLCDNQLQFCQSPQVPLLLMFSTDIFQQSEVKSPHFETLCLTWASRPPSWKSPERMEARSGERDSDRERQRSRCRSMSSSHQKLGPRWVRSNRRRRPTRKCSDGSNNDYALGNSRWHHLGIEARTLPDL